MKTECTQEGENMEKKDLKRYLAGLGIAGLLTGSLVILPGAQAASG